MKVALITPWQNAWVPLFQHCFGERGVEFDVHKSEQGVEADVVVHGWAKTPPVVGARNIVFLRRYELYTGCLNKIDWDHVDVLVCVNDWIANVAKHILVRQGFSLDIRTIYNAVDTARWRYAERRPNNIVGMACHVHPKKNLPLALQILNLLPKDYELHIAGAVQDSCTAEYLNYVGGQMQRRIYLYGHVDNLNDWWEQCGVCLSTSISEGCPNNVLEAMAKGIKPVVHHWPGAVNQFGDHVFTTAQQAAGMIISSEYNSKQYLQAVEDKFSMENIEQVVDIALGEYA